MNQSELEWKLATRAKGGKTDANQVTFSWLVETKSPLLLLVRIRFAYFSTQLQSSAAELGEDKHS